MPYSFRLFLLCATSFFAAPAMADSIRTKDIVGVTTGMTVAQVQENILAYNHAMIIQSVNSEATAELPSYTVLMQGDIPGKPGSTSPQDEISVRFTLRPDGSVLSSAVAHLVNPLPEDQRILIKTFAEKLAAKYGAISNMNDVATGEVRWVFSGDNSQKLRSLASDVADYDRCSAIMPYLPDTATRASLPTTAIPDCGDFLVVRMYAVDAGHPDLLGGYYMMYVNQDKFIKELNGEVQANKDAKELLNYKRIEEQQKAAQSNAGPKL